MGLFELIAEPITGALPALFGVLVGGGMTMFGNWKSIQWSHAQHERVRKRVETEQQAFSSVQGYVKLLRLTNNVFSLKKTIDEQFDNARRAGAERLEPIHKVQAIVGYEVVEEAFMPEELAFLLYSENPNLLSELLVFEKRVKTHQHAINLYNEIRGKITARLNPLGGNFAGTLGEYDIPNTVHDEIEPDQHVLGKLLGDLIERLERDVEDGQKLLFGYAQAATARYGEHFPNVKTSLER